MAFNVNNPTDLLALKNEIQNDPTSRGYAGQGGNDVAIAALLNEILEGNLINTGLVPIREFLRCIVHTEYIGLSAANRAWVDLISRSDQIDLNDTTIKNGLNAIFGAGTGTRTEVQNAQQRNASRAEKLFGIGTTISESDVGAARNYNP